MKRRLPRRTTIAIGAALAIAGGLLAVGIGSLAINRGNRTAVHLPTATRASASVSPTGASSADATPSGAAASSTPAASSSVSPPPEQPPMADASHAWAAYDDAMQTTILLSKETNGMQTWSWSGRQWQPLHPEVEPDAPLGNMAYDYNRRQIVLYARSGIWEWDGSTWSHPDLGPLPPPLSSGDVRMVYDAANRAFMVLIPGVNGTTETWTFDGQHFTRANTSASPSPRSSAGLAYDPLTGQLVYTGGLDASSGSLADTWTWDGRSWTQQHPTTSVGGGWSNLGFDEASRQLILLNAGGTWSWDGSDWHAVPVVASPRPGSQNLDYSPSLSGLLLYASPQGSSPAGMTSVFTQGQWGVR